MASNYTANFGLNQWATKDKVLREEFNADNLKLEAAILAARTAPCCVTGSYAGGATSSKATVDLGFRPSFLVIIRGAQPGDNSVAVALIGTSDCFLKVTYNSMIGPTTSVTVTDTGFTVTGAANNEYEMNFRNTTYYYAAFY